MQTRKIISSVGLSDSPEYYSGRGATISDIDGEKLYSIYKKILEEMGEKQAKAFVTMVKSLKQLSATNFINALYALEINDWKGFDEGNTDNVAVAPDGVERKANGLATITEKIIFCGRDDTNRIRTSFLRKIGL